MATLVQAGVDVIEAEDGQRGLERAFRERPDLVLLDVSMPVLDGFALAACLRGDERTRALPFVFVTDELAPESRVKAYALGAAGYVTKPFETHSFASLVLGLLARMHGSSDPQTAYPS
jgi:CheY-like chemotaxis protein